MEGEWGVLSNSNWNPWGLFACNVENLATKLGSPLTMFSLCQCHTLPLHIISLVPTDFGHGPGSCRSDAIKTQHKMTVLSLHAAFVQENIKQLLSSCMNSMHKYWSSHPASSKAQINVVPDLHGQVTFLTQNCNCKDGLCSDRIQGQLPFPLLNML